MNETPFPIRSQFASTEEADAYDRWLASKIDAAIKDRSRPIPHAEVMADMKALIDSISGKNAPPAVES